MSITYANVVYREDEPLNHVWCEYASRMHTVIEIRYRIVVFEASSELAPNQVFRKEKRVGGSGWKKTPKECRDELRREFPVELSKDEIAWEESLPIGISVSRDF